MAAGYRFAKKTVKEEIEVPFRFNRNEKGSRFPRAQDCRSNLTNTEVDSKLAHKHFAQ